MSLPVEEMVRLAHHMLERCKLGHAVAAPLVGDLACHVLALAEELEHVRAAPRPRTIQEAPGVAQDATESGGG